MKNIIKTKINEFAKKRIENILNGLSSEELNKEMNKFINASMLLLKEISIKYKEDYEVLEEEFYKEYSKEFNLLIN